MTDDTLESDADLLADYRAITRVGGFVALSAWSSVTITGHDRSAFLHNFCTNDVDRLHAGDACEAFLLDVKGKILAHVLITCRDAEFVLISVPGQAPSIIEHLDRYIIREDVQLQDTSDEYVHAYVAGDKNLIRNEIWSFVCHWLRPIVGFVAEFRPKSDIAAELDATGDRLRACRLAAFETARIEAGLPIYGIDFDASNLPQEVGRNREAISFTKGCYLGQETVARVDALGHVNKHLVGVRFAGSEMPPPGLELTCGDQPTGKVTSLAFSPRLQAPLGLAVVRRPFDSPGHTLDSRRGPWQVLALPISGDVS